MDKKYRFEVATEADNKSFSEGLDKLLADLSLSLSMVINKEIITVKNDDGTTKIGFIDVPTFAISKIIEEVVAEKVETPEVSEKLSDELPTEGSEDPTKEEAETPTIDPTISQPE